MYFNIDKVKDSVTSPQRDTFENAQRGYGQEQKYSNGDLTREVNIYECYVKYDMDGKQVLSDWIITVAGEAAVLIGKQKNTLGRFHPFVELVGLPDPWNVVAAQGPGGNFGRDPAHFHSFDQIDDSSLGGEQPGQAVCR